MLIFKRFLADRSASLPVIAALCMLTFIGITGASMDYSNAVRERTILQGMIDSAATALALDKDTGNLSKDEINRRALSYAMAAGNGVHLLGLDIKASVSKTTITIEGSAKVAMQIGRMFGLDYAAVGASVTVERSQIRKLEIALVLDNTRSMKGEKMTQLKAALTIFFDRMEKLVTNPGDVRIAVVPFGRNVRVDKSWMNNAWLENTPPKKWKGCLMDRNKPYDTTDDAPTGAKDRMFVTDDEEKCGDMAAILPLTDSFSKLRARRDELVADGSTNITIGMAWGMHALSPSAPLTEGKITADTPGLIKVIILMTDGDNTDNRWDDSNSTIDSRTRLACSNAKTAGNLVYTIRLLEGNESLLRECASTPQNYHNVRVASDLPNLFEELAGTMTGLRISK